MSKPRLWTIAHRNRHSAIEIHNWRWLDSDQLIIKRDDLSPVGRRGRFGFSMNGGDGGLQCVSTEAARLQSSLNQCQSFSDLFTVPKRAVLLLQQDQISRRRHSR